MRRFLLIVILLVGMFNYSAPAQVPNSSNPAPTPRREVAITIDDLPMGGDASNLQVVQSATKRMLAGLATHKAPAIGFVNEGKIHVKDEVDERINILRMWLDAGAMLGNHTFSHLRLYNTPLQQYQDDVIRGEVITRRLMQERGITQLYFRHPFMNTGSTKEIKDSFEAFLRARNYRVTPYTIEIADNVFNAAHAKAKQQNDNQLAARVRAAYLDYLDTKFDFFERRSKRNLGYEVKQIFLFQVNELNAECLPDMLGRLKQRGYSFITLDQALQDKAYQIPDEYVGQGGISWLHRWTINRGLEMALMEEPEPPKFILDLVGEQ